MLYPSHSEAELTDWYVFLRAAKALGVQVWDLIERVTRGEFWWIQWALAADQAEAKAAEHLREEAATSRR